MTAPARPAKFVLVIEDDDRDGTFERMERTFQQSHRYDFRLEFVSKPEDYATRIAERPYDLYVVDLDLENKADDPPSLRLGPIVIEALAMEQPESPIVAFSARASTGDVVRAIGQGADAFVSKTEGLDSLLKSVEELLDQEREHQEAMSQVQELPAKAFADAQIVAGVPNAQFFVFAAREIRAAGQTRFDALNNYRMVRRKQRELPAKCIVCVELEPILDAIALESNEES